MANSNRNIVYSVADIQRYLKGEMLPAEMHAIEKAALEDPFLADAIEGFSIAISEKGVSGVEADLNSLKESLAKKSAPPARVVPLKSFPWMKMLAAAVILIFTGVFAYKALLPSSESKQLTAQETVMPGPDSSPSKDAVSKSSELKATNPADTLTASRNKPDALLAQQETAQKLSADQQGAPVPHKTNGVSASASENDASVRPGTDESASNKANNASPSARPGEDASASYKKNDASRSLKTNNEAEESAKANDRSASGKANDASASAVQLNEGLVNKTQDRNNNFEPKQKALSPAPKAPAVSREKEQEKSSASARTVPGIVEKTPADSNQSTPLSEEEQPDKHPKSAIVKTEDKIPKNIAANDRKDTSVITATGYGTKKRRYPATRKDSGAFKGSGIFLKDTLMNASPVAGWILYNEYLEKNKTHVTGELINSDNKDNEVIVSFIVDRAGVLSGFTILKSLDTFYDNEAIRLIKEGPAWKLLKGNKTRIAIPVSFQ